MIDVRKLRGVIAEKGMSQRKVAEIIGISEQTFYTTMRKGVFSSAEIDTMISVLEIEDPMQIFFANHVAR